MAADWTPLTDALRALLSEHGLPESHPVAVAVSGGADSMALLHAACAVSSQVTVLHVDHGLREESNADRQFVEAAATSLGCRFQVQVVDGLADRAKTNGLGLEAAAREARYGWFAEVLGEGDVLLTGHHADDQRETQMLHLIRGARPDAWRGMDAWTTERGFTVGRPFLGLPCSALVAVLNEAGVAWREDPSNADPCHLRNRLRHEFIPLLDRLRPGWDVGLDRAAELASEWRSSMLDLLETIPHHALPLSVLNAAPSPRHLMSIWSARHGATAGQLDALMELAEPETETGKRCDTPTHGLVRERDELVARRLESPTLAPQVFDPRSESEGERPTPSGCIGWTVDRVSTRPDIRGEDDVAQVNLGAIEGPLTLRTWRAGDRLAPLGMDGHQSVADILTQRKVAHGDRPSSLILEDALGMPVWLVGHRIDRRAALPTAWPEDGLEVLTLRWVAEKICPPMTPNATPELAAPKTLAEPKDREFALGLYLVLAALFVSSLVTCNLAFRKFFAWTLPGLDYTFEASVGLLPYPLTFLVTDLISEVYGRKRADDVVKAGLAASLLTLGVITLAGAAPATVWSPVNDLEFNNVFGQTALSVGASMAAYLLAQFLDVRIFHFWKMRTGGRMLWLRNNFSTIPSQFVDTMVVLLLLCSVGEIEWSLFGALLVNGFGFKVLVAAVDTPLVYLGARCFRRRFGLEPGQEIAL